MKGYLMRLLLDFRFIVLAAIPMALLGTFPRTAAAAGDEIDVQAAVGEPLGVGKMIVHFAPGQEPRFVVGQTFWLTDSEGRTLYPTYSDITPRVPLVGERKSPSSVTTYFLFRGDRPLRLTLEIDRRFQGTGIAVNHPTAHKALLSEWWISYLSMVERAASADAYPPQIENYLSSMLARRFKLTPPDIVRPWSGQHDVDAIFGTLLGAESVRLAMQKETLLKPSEGSEEPSLPLPAPVAPPAVDVPNVPGDVPMERMARHVPAECFYLRCGSFANFQWLRATVDTWGGNLRDMVAVRGLDYDIRGHVERQLALRETVLSKLLGDAVIADVALIGTDTFFREGAAVGVLFQARNNKVLAAAIGSQRQDALKVERMAAEKTVEIDGHKVSLVLSPDNAVRSFYAVDGDFHLVTTSQTIVRRFFEAGAGKDSLADLKEFRFARSLMPLARKDTLFVYLSDPWFRLLVSPQYRVEMTRRMQAEAEIELVHLARLASKAEKQPADTIDQFIAGGFLPATFGRRPDGSRLATSGGAVVDNLRGGRRSFLPVPDVEINRITPGEKKAYEEFSRMYLTQWQRVDPVIVGVKREDRVGPEGRRDKVVLDVHISPYARSHYGFFAGFLSEPDSKHIAPMKENVIQADVRFGGALSGQPGDPKHRLFGGLRDFAAPFVLSEGRVVPGNVADSDVPMYVGSTPADNPFGNTGGIPEGYSELGNRGLPWFVWARKFDDFLVMAGQKAILEVVTPQIKLEEAERPAQLRLRVADLAPTQAAAILNAYGYERVRRTSAGNVDFMHALIQQLRVPAAGARDTMREALAARPVCPMGGEYKLGPANSTWISTAWAQEYIGNENRVPADFKSPFLQWFHGLDLEFSIDATTLTTHIELELTPQNERVPAKAPLPR